MTINTYEKISSVYNELLNLPKDSKNLKKNNAYIDNLLELLKGKSYRPIFALSIAAFKNSYDWLYGFSYISNVLKNDKNYLLQNFPGIYREYENIINANNYNNDGSILVELKFNYNYLLDLGYKLIDNDDSFDNKAKNSLKSIFSINVFNLLFGMQELSRSRKMF